MMDIDEMKQSDFRALPCREWGEDIGGFDCLVILPTRRVHDSGYRCMDFVAVRGNTPVCRLSGCSDVLHLGGIGARTNPAVAWSVDCLRKSGLLRLFADGELVAGPALSSFDILPKEQK